MNRKSYVHQISEIGPRERVRLRASASAVASERRCIGVDRRCRESEGKAKIEGYMSVSDEEAHQRGCHCHEAFSIQFRAGGHGLGIRPRSLVSILV